MKHSRRRFIGLSKKEQISPDNASTQSESAKNSADVKSEKSQLLTPDGQLVEVDRKVIESNKRGKKASNNQILTWMKPTSKNQ